MVTTDRLRRVLSIFNWTDYRLTIPVQHGCKSSSISTCMEYVVNACVLVYPDFCYINCSLWINFFKSFVPCHVFVLSYLGSIQKAKEPNYQKYRQCNSNKSFKYKPHKNKWKEHQCKHNFDDAPACSECKANHFSRNPKEKYNKKQRQHDPHHPFQNKNHCHLLLVDEIIIWLSHSGLHNHFSKKQYAISLFMKRSPPSKNGEHLL